MNLATAGVFVIIIVLFVVASLSNVRYVRLRNNLKSHPVHKLPSPTSDKEPEA